MATDKNSPAAQVRALREKNLLFEAHDLAERKLAKRPDDDELRAAYAQVRERLGHVDEAAATWESLFARRGDNEEIVANYASRTKRRAIASEDAGEKERLFARALSLYERSWTQLPQRTWSGINVAALRFHAGQTDGAVKVAEAVLTVLADSTPASPGDHAWRSATRAEALLISGKVDEALAAYADLRACVIAGRRWSVFDASRRNLELFDAVRPETLASIRELLRPPPIAVLVGHRVDALPSAGSRPPRLPESATEALESRIYDELSQRGVSIGISGLADGADICFQRTLNTLGAERWVVLPFDEETYAGTSVQKGWQDSYRELLRTANRVIHVLRQPCREDRVSYGHATEVLDGLADLESELLTTEVARMAVWDGRPARGPGGTAETVARWNTQNRAPTIIDPATLGSSGEPPPRQSSEDASDDSAGSTSASTPTPPSRTFDWKVHDPQIVALLFADVKGYSKLNDDESWRFANEYFGCMGEVLDRHRDEIEVAETWGDALFLVVPKLEPCALIALELQEALSSAASWWNEPSDAGPARLGLRIALHAGHVSTFSNPINGRNAVTGAQISHAARIEPIVPPGDVYASETFAAIAKARHAKNIRCNYVGTQPLAKDFGSFRTYRVVRDGDPRPELSKT